MSKRLLMPFLSICFLFCVTGKSIAPSPEKANVFSKTAKMAKGNSGKSLKTLASLNRLDKNVKLKNMNSAAEKELVSSLKDKSVNNAAGTANKTAFSGKIRLNKNKGGYVKFVGAPQGKHFAVDPGSKGKFADKHEVADAFVKKNHKVFAADSSSLTYVMKKISGSTKKSVKYDQLYGGITVFGAEMIVQVDDEDGVDCVISDIMTDSSKLDDSTISLNPTIDSASAAEIAKVFVRENYSGLNNRRSGVGNVRENDSGLKDRRSGVANKGVSKFHPEVSQLETSNIELMIFDPSVVDKDGCVALVWKVEVSGTAGEPIKEVVLVNAHDKGVEFNYSLIYDSKVRQIYDSENSTADPGILKRSEGGPASGIADVDLAYDFYGDTYDFYYDFNDRDSIDNAGMTMSATVRYCYLSCPFYNAFWNGSRMYFGEGFVADDIVGHELTHGVTQYESELIYEGESGAINESLSDMWGEWIDLTNSGGTDTEAVEWVLGEDSPFGAIRCMKNPTMFGDPDRYNSPYFYKDTGWDNGGVHWNSGVGNKLCYLLTDGDSFNGYTIAGEGIPFTERLFYECQVSLLTDSSNYEDLYYALLQAAINLNATAAQQTNIQKACCAVEINMGDDGLPPVHNVNQDTWYSTIQAAIDAADNGNELVVSPGIYTDAINFGGKSITLRSSNPDDWDVVGATIIDTSDEFVNTFTFENGENSASVLKGFTLKTYGSSFGIYCDSSSPTVSNCIIEGSMYGIICIYSSDPTISNCIVRNSSMGGIDCYYSSPTITNCIVANNPAFYGINCYYYSSPVISNCTVVNNGAGINNYLGSPVITNCILWGNVDSDLDGCSATYSCIQYGNPGTGNISSDPLFVALDPFFHLASNSPCINAGDPSGNYSGQTDIDGDVRVIEQRADIGADEFKQRVHNVSQDTWYMTIQAAIDEALNGDQIVVYPGIYEETVNFNGKAITVQGSNPDDWEVVGSTIIDASTFGQYGGDCVTFNHGESLSSVLSGIKMTTGSTAACIRCSAEPNSLAASPAIRNCIMEYAQQGVFGPDSSPEISNCIIRHIDNNGIYCGSPVIYDCIVEFCDEGIGCGGTPVIYDCILGYCGFQAIGTIGGSISNCTIVYDFGDGMRPGNSTVSNCAVVKSVWDGIRFFDVSPTIKNCIMIGNLAGIYCGTGASGTISNSLSIYNRESGIYCRETSSALINNTNFIGNYYAGVISTPNMNDSFKNCIFWKNIGYEIYDGPANITYSDVEGGYSGTGNINSDPLFSDALVHIPSNSPCMNAGDPSGNYTGQTDIDGHDRVVGGIVDIGADENEDGPVINITQNLVYNTIQPAIDDANPNDEIVVNPGTYNETILFPNRPITVRSTDPKNWDIVASTVIIRNGVSLPATINYSNNPDNTNIVFKGFTVTGDGYGIASAGRPPISNCIIRNNTSDGVHAESGAPQVRNCIIKANGRHGVYVYGDCDFSVRNCFVYSNTGTGIYHEMWVDEEDPQQFFFPVIVNNTIVSNGINGFDQTPMTYSIVTNCILWGNGLEDIYGGATYCCIEDGDGGTGNISANPCFVDAANGDYRLLSNSPCITAGTNSAVISGDLDIDNQPRIVHGAVEIGADETSYASVLNNTRDIAYRTIQSAIDNANPNDEIVVNPGTYYETILFPIKAITLRSSDPTNWDVVASTIITRNGGRADTITYPSSSNNSNIVVKGLTITGGRYGMATQGGPPISNCIIRNNTSYGVFSIGGSLQVRNCIIRNNGNHGIYVFGNFDFSVKNCLIYSNGGSGIYHYTSGTQTLWPQIVNNTIVSNTGYGVYNLPATASVVTNCILWGNGIEDMYGLATYSCIEDGDAGTGNISANPCFADAANGNYHLTHDSPCINMGSNSAVIAGDKDIDNQSRTLGGIVDIGVDENENVPILNTATNIVYNTIQSAIDNANPNDEIIVYPGTYHETILFPIKAITLRSSDPTSWDVVAATIITRNGGRPATINYTSTPDNSNIVVKGLTLTGGVYGISPFGGKPPISNCIIQNNTSYGVYTIISSPQFRNCIIRNNGNHGIYVGGDSEFWVKSCLIYSNGGSGIYHFMSGTQTRWPQIVNNTIVSNTGYGVYNLPVTNSVVSNCILWGNGLEDMYGLATYSDIEDGDAGTGNISANPAFADAANSNYHLASNSPCIDAGNNAQVSSDEYDVDYDDRIIDGNNDGIVTVDMGSDEYKP